MTITDADETLRIVVADDGHGGAVMREGHGLRGLSDRVAALGGELELQSAPAAGTQLRVAVPLGPERSRPDSVRP